MISVTNETTKITYNIILSNDKTKHIVEALKYGHELYIREFDTQAEAMKFVRTMIAPK